MPEYVRLLLQRKCTKDLLHAVFFLVFWQIKEIIFLSKGKGFWLLLSILDEKLQVLSGSRLLRKVLGQ